MTLKMDVLFDPDLHPAENRPAHAVQLLGDILPYVYAKYQLARENHLRAQNSFPRPWNANWPKG